MNIVIPNEDIKMKNPIQQDFKWEALYKKYDKTCKNFDPNSQFLYAFKNKPCNDRELYYLILEKIRFENTLNLGTYEGILYWKLYSQPAAISNTCKKIRQDISIQNCISNALMNLNSELPKSVNENIIEIKQLYNILSQFANNLFGMKNSCALPVRSTFLHFKYPNVIPIFDKQVLKAVGISEEKANSKYHFLYEYIEFAWEIKRSQLFPKDLKESKLRLLDMALWVNRGNE